MCAGCCSCSDGLCLCKRAISLAMLFSDEELVLVWYLQWLCMLVTVIVAMWCIQFCWVVVVEVTSGLKFNILSRWLFSSYVFADHGSWKICNYLLPLPRDEVFWCDLGIQYYDVSVVCLICNGVWIVVLTWQNNIAVCRWYGSFCDVFFLWGSG